MYYYNQSLYHFGIKGMKWGIRRYENYDGSYTKAGLKRYKQSESGYDTVRAVRNSVKNTYKGVKKRDDVKITDEGHRDIKEYYSKLKGLEKAYKKQMKADYKQVKQDKLADQGKELYAKGKRITNNADKVATAGLIATGAVAANRFFKANGNQKAANMSLYVGAGMEAVSLGLMLMHMPQDRRLRAYYGHSRPSDSNRTKLESEKQALLSRWK